MTTCSISVNLPQPVGREGIILETPHACKPSSARAAALPSLSSSRRVKFGIGRKVRCDPARKGGTLSLQREPCPRSNFTAFWVRPSRLKFFPRRLFLSRSPHRWPHLRDL